MDLIATACLGALFGLVGGAAAALAVLRNSGPVATARALAEMERLRLDWDAWRKGAEAVLEGMQEVEEVIERKRRRVAARESKEKSANGAAVADPRAELLARARAQGHPV